MNKPVLYIDMDNVLYDTVDAIKYMYDEDFRLYPEYENIPKEQLRSYEFTELKYLDSKRLDEYFCSGRFFDLVPCIECAEVSICMLHTLYEFPVVLVSIGTSENIKGKQQWVDAFNKGMGTNLEFIGIDHYDKSKIDMSGGILIDDELKNLESSNADLKICFGNYDWNKSWDGVRANNWADVRQIIFEEVRRRGKSED